MILDLEEWKMEILEINRGVKIADKQDIEMLDYEKNKKMGTGRF